MPHPLSIGTLDNVNASTIEFKTMPISSRFAITLLVLLDAGGLTAQDSPDFERQSDHPYLLYTDVNVGRLLQRQPVINALLRVDKEPTSMRLNRRTVELPYDANRQILIVQINQRQRKFPHACV